MNDRKELGTRAWKSQEKKDRYRVSKSSNSRDTSLPRQRSLRYMHPAFWAYDRFSKEGS